MSTTRPNRRRLAAEIPSPGSISPHLSVRTLLKPLIRISIRSRHLWTVHWKDACFVKANAEMFVLDEVVIDVADEKGLHRFSSGMQPDFAWSLGADYCGYGPLGRDCLCPSFFQAVLRGGRDSQAIRSCGS